MLYQEGDVSQLYDRWSDSYDADANLTRDLAAALLRGSAVRLAGRRVLELGCGTGANTRWLATQARSVVAVDFSAGMLDRARAAVTAPNVTFVRHDVREPIPLADESIDVVVIALVLEHVPEVAPLFAEVSRVLGRGGEAIVCEYHPYRQLAGGQARFRPEGSGADVRIPAYLHMVGEYVRAALAASLELRDLDERRAADDATDAPPRILFMRLGKR